MTNFSIETFKALKICKNFGKRPILQGINLEINSGEAVGLLGPNGAGKTTFFSILSGLIQPDSGKIYLNDKDISLTPMYYRARLGIGYLPQESSIFRGLSVEDNILAALELVENDQEKREQELVRLLDEFSISHLRQVPALALSGGERRRVEIARALARSPRFLMLDEPLAGIDPIVVNEIRELIIHLKTLNIGILITDHNVRETLDIVDRAYIIANGKVLMQGVPHEIVENSEVRRLYLGERFTF